MTRETAVDRFGRVVIPKRIRERFGLEAGSALHIDESDDGILLKPAQAEPPLRAKGSALVFAGRVPGDADETLRSIREERIQRQLPRRSRR